MELSNTVVYCMLHQVLELHQDILPLVLCHVDPKVRLSVCALVCKAWKAAATASTTSMQYTCRKQRQANSVLKWLTKHGTNVASVHFIVSEAAERLCLDCDLKAWSWLKDLRLTGEEQQPMYQLGCVGKQSGTRKAAVSHDRRRHGSVDCFECFLVRFLASTLHLACTAALYNASSSISNRVGCQQWQFGRNVVVHHIAACMHWVFLVQEE